MVRRRSIASSLFLFLVVVLVSYQSSCVRCEEIEDPERRNLRVDKHTDFQHLRFLVFGTSRAYGVGVRGLHKTFPYLLSRNNTKNVAMKASGPQYSALCTQTMVGDGLYDVIIFEYNLLVDDYLMLLAQRLRARFPKAIMIFLRIWLPFQFRFVPTKQAVLPMIRERYGAVPTMTAPKMLAGLVEGTKPEDWIFDERHDKKAMLDRIAVQVGGHVWDMPRPENCIEAMAQYGRYYTPDMNHYTSPGHRFFAMEIIKLLHELKARKTTQLGKWEDEDSCALWYETGMLSVVHKAPMVNFLRTRYGLEFSTPNNYILAKNPLNRAAFVWIDYMAAAPAGTYPSSHVRLTDDQFVAIEPKLRGTGPLHVMQHAQVGQLVQLNQQTNITVEPLKTDATEHFRIVGIIYTTLYVEEGLRGITERRKRRRRTLSIESSNSRRGDSIQ